MTIEVSTMVDHGGVNHDAINAAARLLLDVRNAARALTIGRGRIGRL